MALYGDDAPSSSTTLYSAIHPHLIGARRLRLSGGLRGRPALCAALHRNRWRLAYWHRRRASALRFAAPPPPPPPPPPPMHTHTPIQQPAVQQPMRGGAPRLSCRRPRCACRCQCCYVTLYEPILPQGCAARAPATASSAASASVRPRPRSAGPPMGRGRAHWYLLV